MSTMKAAVIHRRGGPEVISVDQIPVPDLRPGEVLVRVRACAMNRMDVWARTGPPQPVFLDSIFALGDIREAHRRAESRASFGKIVVTV